MTVKRLLYRPGEAALMLAVSPRTLRRMMRNREIPFVLIGKRRKVAAEDIDRLIKEGIPCPSAGAAKRAPTNSTSNIVDFDYAAARARRKEQPHSA